MKSLLIFALILCSAGASAATPLVQYTWNENNNSSFLMIFDNGAILHQEKAMYQNKTIPEPRLSQEELALIKDLLVRINEEKIYSSPIEVAHSIQQGTLLIRVDKGMKLIEGVIRDSIDNGQGIMYHMDARAVGELKKIIFRYTDNDMIF